MAVGLELNVDAVQAAQSLKELKQLIRDAQSEALKFDEGSEGFRKFTDIAGRAKDRLSDLKETINSLDPSAKAQAFARFGQIVAGGFAGAQGAAALFVGGNQDVEKGPQLFL
jgi:hypothetical protein